MAGDDGPGEQTLGTGNAHIVLRQGIEHGRARRSGDEAQCGTRQHDGGQHEMGRRVAECLPVSEPGRIKQQQSGQALGRKRRDIEAAGTRRPVERAIEHRQHDEGEPECRSGHADQGNHAGDGVDPTVPPHRGKNAQRQAGDEGQQKGDRSQFDGGRAIFGDIL